MDARDEQRSLAENPLPPALPPAVNPLRCPSYIAELDRDIQEHTEAITKLRELRQNALEYAITNKSTRSGSISRSRGWSARI